jgi:hypothetical protein
MLTRLPASRLVSKQSTFVELGLNVMIARNEECLYFRRKAVPQLKRLVPVFQSDQVVYNLWWTKRHWGRFSPNTFVSPVNHFTDCSTLIIIHHPGLVLYAK